MKKGQYPEFTVPGKILTDKKGKVTSIQLDFSKKTFQELNPSVEIREESKSKGVAKVLDFWIEISKVESGKKPKDEYKFKPYLRENGKFTTKARQTQIIQSIEQRGINFGKANKARQKKLFEKETASLSAPSAYTEFDRTLIRETVIDAFRNNPKFSIEIRGTDGRTRLYKTEANALKALDQQLNKIYQSGAQFRPRNK